MDLMHVNHVNKRAMAVLWLWGGLMVPQHSVPSVSPEQCVAFLHWPLFLLKWDILNRLRIWWNAEMISCVSGFYIIRQKYLHNSGTHKARRALLDLQEPKKSFKQNTELADWLLTWFSSCILQIVRKLKLHGITIQSQISYMLNISVTEHTCTTGLEMLLV